jgi:hypothetical protein
MIMPSPVDLRGVARAAAAESAERFHAAGAAMQQHAAKRQQHAASSGVHLAHRISQLCSARLVAVSERGPCVSVFGAGALSAANYSECSVRPGSCDGPRCGTARASFRSPYSPARSPSRQFQRSYIGNNFSKVL